MQLHLTLEQAGLTEVARPSEEAKIAVAGTLAAERDHKLLVVCLLSREQGQIRRLFLTL